MDVNKPASGISKCPISKAKKLTFGFAAKALGMVNERPILQEKWNTYDIDTLYTNYLSSGEKPFISKPNERETFLRYAHSQLSIHATTEFLSTPIENPIRSINRSELLIDDKEIHECFGKICYTTIGEIFDQYMNILVRLYHAESKDTKEEKLIQMIDNTADKLDGELVRFSTISGTLPSIDNIFTDFRDVLKAREILDLDSFLLAIAEDKTIPARALSNIPNMSIYLYERYKNGFLFFPRTRTNKAISRFMENGFPTTIFNPVSQKREFIFTKDDFEKLAPVVLDKHPVLQKWTYSGCPLLYARKDGVNMITAVHIKIAEIAFNRLRGYIMEQQL